MLSVFLSPTLLVISSFLDFFLEVDLASTFLSPVGILERNYLVLLHVFAVAI